jgi:hypothetical protein
MSSKSALYASRGVIDHYKRHIRVTLTILKSGRFRITIDPNDHIYIRKIFKSLPDEEIRFKVKISPIDDKTTKITLNQDPKGFKLTTRFINIDSFDSINLEKPGLVNDKYSVTINFERLIDNLFVGEVSNRYIKYKYCGGTGLPSKIYNNRKRINPKPTETAPTCCNLDSSKVFVKLDITSLQRPSQMQNIINQTIDYFRTIFK